MSFKEDFQNLYNGLSEKDKLSLLDYIRKNYGVIVTEGFQAGPSFLTKLNDSPNTRSAIHKCESCGRPF